MLDVLIAVLLIGWLLGIFAFKVSSGLLHLLLIVACVIIIVRLIQGRAV